MVRLRREDIEDPDSLAHLARTIQLTPEEFRDRFGYLVDKDQPARAPALSMAT
jgi:hypothetical protein